MNQLYIIFKSLTIHYIIILFVEDEINLTELKDGDLNKLLVFIDLMKSRFENNIYNKGFISNLKEVINK